MFEYITAAEVERCLIAMAKLDIILVPKKSAWLRTVAFSKENGHRRAVVDNGSGDSLIALFTDSGAMLKGFDHESELNQFAADEWDNGFFERIYSGVPEALKILLSEDDIDNTTFCMWCSNGSAVWEQNEEPADDDDGGRDFLLGYVHQTAESWCDWAKYYYEQEYDLSVVEKIYSGTAVSADDILKLDPKCNAEEALQEIAEMI
ncbi:MAG: hypothetical protein E7478_05300 [Ruminococcaceae bacterium]|nr:hypothetical protein [Oscillospiraceae bacterium]